MQSIWLAVSPGTRATRILGMRGHRETILKARLSLRPQSPYALAALLETLAAWEGGQVHGALVAGDGSTSSSTTLFHDNFAVFGRETDRWQLEWVAGEGRRCRDRRRGLGEFGDLTRLLTRASLR